MSTSNPPNTYPLIVLLEPDQCWSHLQQSQTGRVAFIRDGEIELRPVNYAAVDRVITFTTGSSVLIDAARTHQRVVFEADEHDGWTVWSVLVRGNMTLTDAPAVSENRPLVSMVSTPKTHCITIEPKAVSGRLFDQARMTRARQQERR